MYCLAAFKEFHLTLARNTPLNWGRRNSSINELTIILSTNHYTLLIQFALYIFISYAMNTKNKYKGIKRFFFDPSRNNNVTDF